MPISNWAKCIKLKLVILDWVSKQFSGTSFPVGSADRRIALYFSLEEDDYQEDNAVLFGIRKKKCVAHTCNIVSVDPRHRSTAHFWVQLLANRHDLYSVLETTGPTSEVVCQQWLCLPMNVHCIFIHVDGSLVLSARCH